MFYTQRRAKIDLPGVEWCHGTEIGVAESSDSGFTWSYIGTLDLSHPDSGYSFWAPDIIRDDKGVFHMFPSYVPGGAERHINWGGERHLFHYTSTDLRNWKFEQRVPVGSDYCIDATLFRKPDGVWRMWYKDEGNGSKTFAVESTDLRSWKHVEDPGVSKLYGEGPKSISGLKDITGLLRIQTVDWMYTVQMIWIHGHIRGKFLISPAHGIVTEQSENMLM